MSYYLLGKHSVLQKMGMLAGTAGAVEYKPGKNGAAARGNEQQDLWAEFDQEPGKTHEEKIGSLCAPITAAAPYSQKQGADDYSRSSSGGTERASGDAYADDPSRDHRLSRAMHESFKALDQYDPSFGPEPGLTQPHGSGKYAMSGVSSVSAASALSPPPLPKINAGAPKPKQPKIVGNAQHRILNNVHDIDTSMSTGSVGRRMSGSAL